MGTAGRGWWAGLALLLFSGTTSAGAAGHAPASGVAHVRSPQADEHRFLAENDAAMRRMMTGMSIGPTGDVDRDFVDMMTPHHQGAIDMAILVLRYGRNEQVRRLAQEVIVDQQQEIAAMRLAVGEAIPPSAPAPTVPAQSLRPIPPPPSPMPGMDMR